MDFIEFFKIVNFIELLVNLTEYFNLDRMPSVIFSRFQKRWLPPVAPLRSLSSLKRLLVGFTQISVIHFSQKSNTYVVISDYTQSNLI